MKDFKDTTILRFARLELVRGDWRKYTGDLSAPGEYIANDNNNRTQFNLAAVNLEENGNRKPINYVLPPGIERVVDPTNSTNIRQQNEQSLSLKICDLLDGKSKAAYRNLDLDIRLYKHLNMFVHAERAGFDTLSNSLKDGDAKFFIRLGNDFDQNYYEYEYPLRFTNAGATAREDVWPTTNDLDLELQKLLDVKTNRNNKALPLTNTYSEADPDDASKTITVIGNPTLSSVKTIMVGVRNPKRQSLQDVVDDGKSMCLEVWVNELRSSDFNQQGGYAANGRLQAKLADFADLTVTASYKSQGFGGIEQKIQERSRDNTFLYDISSNIRLNKFLPASANIQLPMFVDFSEGRSLPQFDPLNPDLNLKQELGAAPRKSLRDSIRYATEDYTRRKSINFTNVKKDKGKNSKKAHFYDIENLTASYSYNEVYKHNINIDSSLQRQHKAGLAYNFAMSPKGIKPFDKMKVFSGSSMKAIKEFNFNFIPSRYSFRTDIDRQFNLFKPRNADIQNSDAFEFKPFYDKKFTMSRIYDFKYDPAKSINFDYTATNLSRIDEPLGVIDNSKARDYRQYRFDTTVVNAGPTKRDSVIQNLKNFGRTTSFTQTANLSWTIPINKIPILNWITSTASYRGKYDWNAAPPRVNYDTLSTGVADTSKPVIANTISNSNQKQVNLNFNFVTLYNKVPYLKNINSPKPKKTTDKKNVVPKTPAEKAKQDSLRKLETKEQKALRQAKEKAAKDSAKGPNILLQEIARTLMMLKSASVNYTEGEGTMLPGYLRKTQIIGLSDNSFSNASAPGLPFVFGIQDTTFLNKAGANGWITSSTNFNQPLTKTFTSTFTGKVTIEPVKDFKIDLNWNRTENRNNQGIYKDTAQIFGQPQFQLINSNETGNYSISTITWKTAFVKDLEADGYNNSIFQAFISNRKAASEKVAKEAEANLNGNYSAQKDNATGYYDGYGETQQDVLVSSFYTAYTGQSVSKTPLNFLKQMPKPNWRVAYDGLGKIAAIKKYFKTFTINHSYRSTFNVASYTTNQFFIDDTKNPNAQKKYTLSRDIKENFRSQNEIQVVTLSESMSPFIGVDGTLQNSLQLKLQLNRERNISLSLANAQITEIKSNEVVTGVGYKFKDVKPPLSKRYGLNIKSDLNLRCDVSVRRNYTLIRRLASEVDTLNPQLTVPASNTRTAGTNTLSIRFSADYTINQRLNIRFFFDKIVNKPLVSASFRTSNANSGIALRFTIAQ
jgi:cell surface protein SprA